MLAGVMERYFHIWLKVDLLDSALAAALAMHENGGGKAEEEGGKVF